MPDEGNLDPGCSRLHHDEYETSGASSRTSSRPTLNQMERWGRSLGEWGTRMLSGTTLPQEGKTYIRSKWDCRCSPKDVSARTFKRTAKGTSALTISFKGPVLDFCAFTNIMQSNNFSTEGNCNVFYNECWHFRAKWILTQVWWSLSGWCGVASFSVPC